MKIWLAAATAGGFLIVAAQAQGSGETGSRRNVVERQPDWSGWTRPLGLAARKQADARPGAENADAQPMPAAEEFDVVDAHWMALTMWGEARGQGEEGMRAVGHVIRNRWLAKRHGAYVTDTVSAAWQFSCWNEGDPNRAAMLNIEALPKESGDYRRWLAAKRVAGEILSGQSLDPTGGALFYHTTAVQPRWSRGVAPVTQIGRHLFFLL